MGGVYTFASGTALIANGETLTLDCNSDSTSVWIFQLASTITLGNGSNIILANVPGGITNIPVFWIVGSSATIGTNSHIVGTVLAAVSISMGTGSSSNSLFALGGAVTLDNNSVRSYSVSSASGGDPHIICLDGSRLDIYEEGIYKMFDSNCEERMIINTEIVRVDHSDMYKQFYMSFPDGKTFNVKFLENNQIEVTTSESKFIVDFKWSHTYVSEQNNYYVVEIETEDKSFLMKTNNGGSQVNYRGLLAGEIITIPDLYDVSSIEGTRTIYPGYYKYNAVLAGSTLPHIIKLNRDRLLPRDGMFRLYQDKEIKVNVQLDENGLIRKLNILKDFEIYTFEWVGENFWDLKLYKNGALINQKLFVQEYKTDNIIFRIQDNASVSIGIRTVSNIDGLFCGRIINIVSLFDFNYYSVDQYEHVKAETTATSNYRKYIEIY